MKLGHLITCAACGAYFAFDEIHHSRRLKDGKEFFCPNGHSNHYGDTEVSRLRRQVEAAERNAKMQSDSREAAARRCAALKGALTRAQKKAKR